MQDPLPDRDQKFKTALARRMHQLEKQDQYTQAAWLLYEAIVSGKMPAYEGKKVDLNDLLQEAFFAGALHMHSAIARVINETEEHNIDKAFAKIEAMKKELDAFDDMLRLKYGNAVGTA